MSALASGIGRVAAWVGDQLSELRASYSAAKQNGRFRRRRSGIQWSGSSSDYHVGNEADYMRMVELARDMDRNDAIVGQLVDRAVSNIIQEGFVLDVDTGDDALDQDLTARWTEWSTTPRLCDKSGMLTFCDIEGLALRHVFVDGDVFVLPVDDGSLQLIEGHRVRSPFGSDGSVVVGVELDAFRRRMAYHFTADDIGTSSSVGKAQQFKRVSAYAENGMPLVLHLFDMKRASQTRGITAFAPVVDLVGMFDDINFAKLVQQQVVSCVSIFREREVGFMPGGVTDGQQVTVTTGPGGEMRTLVGMSPGMQIVGAPGEKLTGFSPNIPNAEFFAQARLILQIVGLNLGMPLVLVLLDGSETNFSGWRGAMDQAKLGFRRIQKRLMYHLHEPVFRTKVAQWSAGDKPLARAVEKAVQVEYTHRWNLPSWPYIEPKTDAEADRVRLESRLISPRRVHAERGRDWDDVADEIVADNVRVATSAIEAANKLNAAYPDADVDWRELASFAPDAKSSVEQPSTGDASNG